MPRQHSAVCKLRSPIEQASSRSLIRQRTMLVREHRSEAVIRTDNKSIIELSRDAIAFKKTKHILRAAMFLRDLCLRLIFTLRWISGETNPAELFTKAHPVTVFRALMRVFARLQHVA